MYVYPPFEQHTVVEVHVCAGVLFANSFEGLFFRALISRPSSSQQYSSSFLWSSILDLIICDGDKQAIIWSHDSADDLHVSLQITSTSNVDDATRTKRKEEIERLKTALRSQPMRCDSWCIVVRELELWSLNAIIKGFEQNYSSFLPWSP